MKKHNEMWLRCAAVLVLFAALALSFSACGKESEDASDGTQAAAPAGDKDYDINAGVIQTAEFAETVLAETEDAGAEYVEDTLFLGDSNTVRFMMYADESTGKAYTGLSNNIGVVSMGVGAITTLKCEEFVGYSSAVTMPEAVGIMQPRRIIITFGTNNLSGKSTDATKFIADYKKGLDAIHAAYSYAPVIVNSIPPLDARRENTNITQTQVDAWNKAIAELCKTEDWLYYLNSAEVLKDETTGWAKTDYTLGDGVHLSQKAITALFGYIRTHAHEGEDTRPQPLKAVPQAKGVAPGLISSDPIAVRGARVNVEVAVTEGGTASASSTAVKATQNTTLTATPDEGYSFGYWELVSGAASLSGSDSATATLTVNEGNDANGIVVCAHFVPNEETWYDWVTDKQPTCSESGHATRKSSWDNTEEKTLDPLGHNYQAGEWSAWSGDATVQTQTRTRTETCSRCGANYQDTESRANPDYVVPTPAPTPTPTPVATPTPEPDPNPTPEPEPKPDPEPEPDPGPAPSEPEAGTAAAGEEPTAEAETQSAPEETQQ